MVIFHSYVSLPEGKFLGFLPPYPSCTHLWLAPSGRFDCFSVSKFSNYNWSVASTHYMLFRESSSHFLQPQVNQPSTSFQPLLVGGIPTPLKNILVSWDYDIPKIWKVIQNSMVPVTTNQINFQPSTSNPTATPSATQLPPIP